MPFDESTIESSLVNKGVSGPIASSTSSKTHKFAFTGTAWEYAKIWIANIALTILTLGIYAPWAKVRRERYLATHTYLGNSTFDYVANPWAILKGRVIILVALVICAVAESILPGISIVFGLIFLILLPWIITSALKFRANCMRYRNIAFHFSGTYWRTLKNYQLFAFVGFITLGVLYPWAKHRARKYFIENLHFGKTAFTFQSSLGQFYRAYLMALAPFLLPILFFATRAMFAVQSVDATGLGEKAASTTSHFLGSGGAAAIITSAIAAFLMAPLILRVMLTIATWSNVKVGEFKVTLAISEGPYLWILISNALLRIVTLGLATPFCLIRSRRYIVEHLELSGAGSLDGFIADRQKEVLTLGDQAAELHDVGLDCGF